MQTTDTTLDNSAKNNPSALIKFIVVLLPIVGIIVALLFTEIAFRLLGSKSNKKGWSDRPQLYFMPSSAQNLQDKTYADKKNGTYRVVVVGDSFTFGPHIALDDTFSKRLERWLNLNEESKTLEVLNYGFSGHATHDEVNDVELAIKAKADLVVLEITLNDAEDHVLSKDEREALFGDAYLNKPIFKYWKSLGFVMSRIHNSATYNAYIQYHAGGFENSPTAEVFKNSLKKIEQSCKEHNVKLIAVVFPMFDFPLDDNYPFLKTHQIIHQGLEAASIPYLDLFESFKGIPNDRLQVIPGKDSHPNEIAHRLAAEELLQYLSKNQLVPTENIPKRVYKARVNIKEKRFEKWLTR